MESCKEFVQVWWKWHPPVGVFIGLLAVGGVLVPWFRGADISKREKAFWTFLMFLLTFLELRTLYLDRDQHDLEQAFVRCQELKSFKEISDGITAAISKSDENFRTTMAKSDAILGGVSESLKIQTGGDSFCYVQLSPFPATGLMHVFLIQKGHNHLFNVNVRVVDIDAPISLATEPQFSVPFVAHGTALELTNLPLGDGDYRRFNIFFMTPNGHFTESIRLKKIAGTWREARWVTASYYNGTYGLVDVENKDFPQDIFQNDPDWKAASKLKRIRIKP